jgi:hypothetical protein
MVEARIFEVITAVKIQAGIFWVVRCRAGLRQETDVSEDSATSIFGVMST